MELDFHQNSYLSSSPFILNMDTIQSSLYRLSLDDLHRVSKVYSVPNLERIGSSGSAAGKKMNWSNNSWIRGSPNLNSSRATPNSTRVRKKLRSFEKEHARSLKKEEEDAHTPVESPGPLTPLPLGERISPLSPSFSPALSHPETSISISPRFNWRHLEQQVSGKTEHTLLTELCKLHLAVTKSNPAVIKQLSDDGLDLGLPLRGVTALSLAIHHGKVDILKELLREMLKTRSVRKNINIPSVDSVSRRESPLITAARNGSIDCVRVLCNYGADLEARDGEGHTALWCAVREQKLEMVNYLIIRGAKVFYENNDISCPLQLACKIPLLKDSGKQIASILISHGANLEYRDRALRNTLFWVVYNNSRDLAYYIIQSGARVQPWSWVDKQYLPEQIKQDDLLTDLINSASTQPQKLLLISVCSVRQILSRATGGKSILSKIDELPLSVELKKILRLESATSRRRKDIQKLHRLCSETQV